MASRSTLEQTARLDQKRALFDRLSKIAVDLCAPEVTAYFDDVDRGYEKDILEVVAKDPEKARVLALQRDAFRSVRALITNSPRSLEAIDTRLAKLTKDSSNAE